MGLFSKEQPYSREAYDAQEKVENIKWRSYRYMGSGFSQDEYNRRAEAAGKARKKLEKLKAQGTKEAIALNEEYDRLCLRADQAFADVEAFQRDKLGMKEENKSEGVPEVEAHAE